MRIGRHTNSISCEYDMQDSIVKWLIWLSDEPASYDIKFLAEKSVKEVSRRADFLVLKGGGLINIEAKSNDLQCMMGQLADHATYCDYSFAAIPDYTLTPKWFKEALVARGYGLITYSYDKKIAVEALEAHHNRPKNTQLRRRVVRAIRGLEEYQISIFE